MRKVCFRKKCAVLAAAAALLTGCAKPGQTPGPTEYAGETVGIREEMRTILLAFLDDQGLPADSSGFRNPNRADMMLLAVVDERRETITALHLNPDTVVSFTPPGTGEKAETALGLVYSYGSGGSDSCLSGMRAVSQLLGGIPIDHYMTFTADAVAVVNDMLGGVTVTVDGGEFPDLEKGETVTLTGEEAVSFLRFRESGDITNEAHMERQRRYLAGIFPSFLESAEQDDFLSSLTFQAGEGVATDMTLSQMVKLLDLLYGLDQRVVTVPGTAEQIDGAYRFQVDREEMDKIVEDLFSPKQDSAIFQ